MKAEGRDNAALSLAQIVNFNIEWCSRAVATIKSKINLSDEVCVDVKDTVSFPAKAWFLKQGVNEIEKVLAGLQLFSQVEKIEAIDSKEAEQLLALHIDQLSAQSRKLKELITRLILFKDTNEEAYYHHYILIEEYAYKSDTIKYMGHYYECDNAHLRVQLQNLESTLQVIETRLDVKKLWHTAATNGAGVRKSKLEKKLFDEAILKARDVDRLAMGYFYASYAADSGKIHVSFGVTKTRKRGANQDMMLHVGLDLMRAITNIGELLGLENDKTIKEIKTYSESDTFVRMAERYTHARIKAGDLVAVFSHLAIVVEIAQSKIGYRRFRVKFVSTTASSGLQEDWYPASMVHHVMSHGEFVRLIGKRRKKISTTKVISIGEVERKKLAILAFVRPSNSSGELAVMNGDEARRQLVALVTNGQLDAVISAVAE